MRTITPLLTIFILALGTGLPANAQNTCSDPVLPPQASMVVSEKFPGWRVKAVSDLEGYDRELWLKEHPKECPGIAVGHFEDPSQAAYALLLLPKSAVPGGYKLLVVAKAAGGDKYVVRVLDEEQGSDAGLVISKVPPGKQTGFDTTQSVRLKLDGFEAEWLEKSSVLYYWRNGKYQTLETSD